MLKNSLVWCGEVSTAHTHKAMVWVRIPGSAAAILRASGTERLTLSRHAACSSHLPTELLRGWSAEDRDSLVRVYRARAFERSHVARSWLRERSMHMAWWIRTVRWVVHAQRSVVKAIRFDATKCAVVCCCLGVGALLGVLLLRRSRTNK